MAGIRSVQIPTSRNFKESEGLPWACRRGPPQINLSPVPDSEQGQVEDSETGEVLSPGQDDETRGVQRGEPLCRGQSPSEMMKFGECRGAEPL